jgi:MFS transporter, PPP family, 3-phenylpropionic acid transporter
MKLPFAVRDTTGSLAAVATTTFLNYAARGLTLPFISLYLVSMGFSGTDIGIVLSLSALVRLIVPPLMNTLADRTGQHLLLYNVTLIGNAAATTGLVGTLVKPWLAAMVIIRDSLDSPSASLLGQLTITRLEQIGRDIYGQLRAWGSVGWTVATMLSGYIYGLGGYTLLFCIAGLLNLISLPFARSLPRSTTIHKQQAPSEGNTKFNRSPAFYLLMVSWFLFCIAMNASAAFMFLYFQQDLGSSNAMVGVLAGTSSIAEVPSMILIDSFLHRYSLRLTLIIGMLGMAGLWLSIAWLADSSLLIPVMAVRGVFFAFQNIAITLYISRISHPENAATNQAIAQVTVPAFASLVTGALVGWIFDVFGARTLFRLVALIALSAAVILLVGRHILDAELKRERPP